MERIRFLLDGGPVAVLAALLCEHRICCARIQGFSTVVDGIGATKEHACNAFFGGPMAQAQRCPAQSDDQESRSEHTERQDAVVHRDFSGNYAHFPRIAGEGTSQLAAVAASAVCRTLA